MHELGWLKHFYLAHFLVCLRNHCVCFKVRFLLLLCVCRHLTLHRLYSPAEAHRMYPEGSVVKVRVRMPWCVLFCCVPSVWFGCGLRPSICWSELLSV